MRRPIRSRKLAPAVRAEVAASCEHSHLLHAAHRVSCRYAARVKMITNDAAKASESKEIQRLKVGTLCRVLFVCGEVQCVQLIAFVLLLVLLLLLLLLR